MPIERSKEPVQFAAFELSGWDKNMDGHDRAFGGVRRQTVRPLLDAAKVTGGMRVLDVCYGPGMLLAIGALQRGPSGCRKDRRERREGNGPVAMIGSDYSNISRERRVDQVVVNHGTRPLNDIYFDLRPGSTNLGESRLRGAGRR